MPVSSRASAASMRASVSVFIWISAKSMPFCKAASELVAIVVHLVRALGSAVAHPGADVAFHLAAAIEQNLAQVPLACLCRAMHRHVCLTPGIMAEGRRTAAVPF